MGLMDKVKGQASALASKAQEGVSSAQDKISGAQEKRHRDSLLHDLGALTLAEHQGAVTEDHVAQVNQILSEIAKIDAGTGSGDPVPPETT